jgi:hypothetical protein
MAAAINNIIGNIMKSNIESNNINGSWRNNQRGGYRLMARIRRLNIIAASLGESSWHNMAASMA